MNSFSGQEWKVPQSVNLVPDVGSFSLNSDKVIQTKLSSRIVTEEQLIWITDYTAEVGYDGIQEVGFEEVPRWREGREESVQGVFFGYLALGDEIEVPVAVKPFLSATSVGAHETVLSLYLQDKALPVYEVLGVSWTDDQGFTLILRVLKKNHVALIMLIGEKG